MVKETGIRSLITMLTMILPVQGCMWFFYAHPKEDALERAKRIIEEHVPKLLEEGTRYKLSKEGLEVIAPEKETKEK